MGARASAKPPLVPRPLPPSLSSSPPLLPPPPPPPPPLPAPISTAEIDKKAVHPEADSRGDSS